jgi:hypothetical protein
MWGNVANECNKYIPMTTFPAFSRFLICLPHPRFLMSIPIQFERRFLTWETQWHFRILLPLYKGYNCPLYDYTHNLKIQEFQSFR